MKPGEQAAPRRYLAEPLTPEAFAPFGFVLMADRGDVEGRPVNRGTARRFDELCALHNLRPDGARLNVCVFRCAPHVAWPMRIDLLEKHPRSTQMFVPMNARRYVVVVAEPNERAPDLATLRAFVATGRQGIAYGPGVWHHPLIAVDDETDFACMVYEDGSSEDCVVATFDAGSRPIVALDGDVGG